MKAVGIFHDRFSAERLRRMKRMMAVLTGLMLLCLAASALSETLVSNGFKYTIQADGTAMITGRNSKNGTLIIPKTINGKTVTAIGKEAFYLDKDISSVTIPDGIVRIGDRAFYNCENISTVSLPESLREIGESAFFYCKKIARINWPDGISSIGKSAFYGCAGIKSVQIPSALRILSEEVFGKCESLKKIEIPSTIKRIEADAFVFCEISEVTFTKSPIQVLGNPFAYCRFLQKITVPSDHPNLEIVNGCLTDRKEHRLIWYPKTSPRKTFTIPPRITKLEKEAFAGCNDLEEITLPEGVKVIGDSCFMSTGSLRVVHLPSSLRKIDEAAFYASAVKTLVLPKELEEIGKNAFYRCTNLITEVYPSSYSEQYCQENGVKYSIVKSSLARERRKMQSIFMRQMIHNPKETDFYGCWSFYGVLSDTDLTPLDYDDQIAFMVDEHGACAVLGESSQAAFSHASLGNNCLTVSGASKAVLSLLLSEDGEVYMMQHVEGRDDAAIAYRKILPQEYLTLGKNDPFAKKDQRLLAGVYEFDAVVKEVKKLERVYLAGIKVSSTNKTSALYVVDGEEMMKKMKSSKEVKIRVKALLLGWTSSNVPYFITTGVKIK